MGAAGAPQHTYLLSGRSGDKQVRPDRGAQRSGAGLRGTRPHAWLHHVAPRVCTCTAAAVWDSGCTAPALTVQ